MNFTKIFYFFLLPLFFAFLGNLSPLLRTSSSISDASPLIFSEEFTTFTPVETENPSLSETFATFSTENVVNMNTNREATSNGASFSIINPETVSTPAVDAGLGVKRYRSLLYAHSTAAFAPIKSLSVGDLVSLTENGATTLYRVSTRNIYSKPRDLDGAANSDFRWSLYSASGHALNLMTCGNGYNDDSAYRLVLSLDLA